DRVPYALGGRARFVLDRIEPHGKRELGYRIRSDVRGRYRVGPLTVRLADPFGMVELVRSFSLSDTLTVTPALVALPSEPLGGAWSGGGDSIAGAVSAAGEDDVTPREYRHGDDLRRVHWRSTARHGELMVRREEQHFRSSGTLFLDTRRRAHRGEGPAGSFEQAVSAAASIGVHLVRAGLSLRYVTDAGETLPAASADGGFEGLLLDRLAITRRSKDPSLTAGVAALRGRTGSAHDADGLVIAVFGVLTAEEARSVAAARRGAGTCVAVLVEGTGAAGRRDAAANGRADGRADAAADARVPAETAAGLLRAAGWRVVTIRSAADLPGVWSRAARTGEDFVRDGS